MCSNYMFILVWTPGFNGSEETTAARQDDIRLSFVIRYVLHQIYYGKYLVFVLLLMLIRMAAVVVHTSARYLLILR